MKLSYKVWHRCEYFYDPQVESALVTALRTQLGPTNLAYFVDYDKNRVILTYTQTTEQVQESPQFAISRLISKFKLYSQA